MQTMTISRKAVDIPRTEIPLSAFAVSVMLGKKVASRYGLPVANSGGLATFIAENHYAHPWYHELPFPWQSWPKVHDFLKTRFQEVSFSSLLPAETELVLYVKGQRTRLISRTSAWMAISIGHAAALPIYPVTGRLEEPYTYIEAAWTAWTFGHPKCLIAIPRHNDVLIISDVSRIVGALSAHINAYLEHVANGSRHPRLPSSSVDTIATLCRDRLSRPQV